MPEHDDPEQYWMQRYWDTVAEHDKELTAYRKHLSNKYKPVFDQIMKNHAEAKVARVNIEKGDTPS